VAIIEERLDQAEIDATVTKEGDSVVISFDREESADAGRVVELSTRTGLLELYDLEANVLSPSRSVDGSPVATQSLYDLLAGRQPRVGEEDEIESWYLFDSEKKLAGGPSPTKQLLLPSGGLLDGWRILAVPAKTAVLECGIGEVTCPGVGVANPREDSYYLVRHDPPVAPELDGGDLELEGTRHDFDNTTGQPIVLMRFTADGAARFGEITKREAQRGKRIALATAADPGSSLQHFAIVLDREIKSWPSIDWEQYPNGISGVNGAQITGIGDLREAEDLALVLQTGALTVRFEVVPKPASGG
jgi:preprotein translocase subunit SecD